MKKSLIPVAVFGLLFAPLAFSSPPTPPNVTVVKLPAQECETLSYKGTLRETSSKAVVLEIKKESLEDIFSSLKKELPEYASLPVKEKRIEVTIITAHERKKESLAPIEELNEEFSFGVGGISLFTHELGKIAVLPLISPDLDHLRSKYGLPEKKFSGELFLPSKAPETKKESSR
jgi:hypothetical protein